VKSKDILKLVMSIVLCQLAGVLGSLFTSPAIPTWYKTLNKPFFTPPDWIFGPVWISLFILMGISLFMIWRRQDHPRFKLTLVFFLIQLILNILWSVAFFGLRSPLLGLVDIVLLWVAILLMIQHFSKVSGMAGFLLLPYLLWVGFAALLNFYLWILNR
jgi:tryptophan-rich sensory protein